MFKGLKSLLAGLVAGTAVGVLFAPKKGEETRQNIKEGGLSSVKSTLAEMGKDIGETYKDCCDDLEENETVQKYVGKAKDMYKEKVPAKQRREIKKNVNKAKKTVKKGYEKAKKTVDDVANRVKKSK